MMNRHAHPSFICVHRCAERQRRRLAVDKICIDLERWAYARVHATLLRLVGLISEYRATALLPPTQEGCLSPLTSGLKIHAAGNMCPILVPGLPVAPPSENDRSRLIDPVRQTTPRM
jgi:hypothetical protein